MRLLSFFRDFSAIRAPRALCNGLKFGKKFTDDEYVARWSRRGRQAAPPLKNWLKLRKIDFFTQNEWPGTATKLRERKTVKFCTKKSRVKN
jgi:hypothetical protein